MADRLRLILKFCEVSMMLMYLFMLFLQVLPRSLRYLDLPVFSM